MNLPVTVVGNRMVIGPVHCRHSVLPPEVRTEIERRLMDPITSQLQPGHIVFASKYRCTRAQAWDLTQLATPAEKTNTWRRAHTDNFWVWYSTEQPPSI